MVTGQNAPDEMPPTDIRQNASSFVRRSLIQEEKLEHHSCNITFSLSGEAKQACCQVFNQRALCLIKNYLYGKRKNGRNDHVTT